jgi:hypothetical protein
MKRTVRWTYLAPALLAWVAACGDSGHAPARSDAAAGPDTDLSPLPPEPTVDAAAFDSAVEAAGARSDTPRIDLPAPADIGLDRQVDVAIDLAGEAGTGGNDVSLGSCSSPLAGQTPFGAAIGNGIFIYFPGGRVAGAPVQLGVASPVVAGQYFFGPQVVLADDLSATGLKVAGHDKQVVGDLLPGTGGLAATVTANAASPGSDVADIRKYSALLCAAGDVPEPAMELLDTGLSPISPIGVKTTTPLTTSGLAALRITSPLGPVAIQVSPDPYAGTGYAHGPNYVITAVSALPPGQRLSVDASQVRDVLGRPVPLKQDMLGNPVVLTVLGTSAVLSDLTFASAPPSGAVAGSGGGTVTNGILSFTRSGSSSGRNVDGLLALPPLSATELRVRIRVGDDVPGWPWCVSDNRSASMEWAAMAVVGPNGESSYRIALSCNGMVDRVLDLPKASPLWLAVHVEGVAPTPYYLPPGTAPSVFIDELTPL